eukprot:15481235-Alexandrium_andersonii.AAC.1
MPRPQGHLGPALAVVAAAATSGAHSWAPQRAPHALIRLSPLLFPSTLAAVDIITSTLSSRVR